MNLYNDIEHQTFKDTNYLEYLISDVIVNVQIATIVAILWIIQLDVMVNVQIATIVAIVGIIQLIPKTLLKISIVNK